MYPLTEYFRRTHPSPVRRYRPLGEDTHGAILLAPRVRRVLVLKLIILIGFALAAVEKDAEMAFWTMLAANGFWLFFVKE